MKRVFLIVLDSFGIGEAPDADKFGDVGANTLRTISGSPKFNCPNMTKLGLFNVEGTDYKEGVENPIKSSLAESTESTPVLFLIGANSFSLTTS